jgi:hypothetical protein
VAVEVVRERAELRSSSAVVDHAVVPGAEKPARFASPVIVVTVETARGWPATARSASVLAVQRDVMLIRLLERD